MKGFREFILRGNVIDLAVAVVMGAAFGTVVASFVKDLLTPLIAAIGGQPDFSKFVFTVHGSQFHYGDFVNSIIAFLIVAAAVYFLVVMPLMRMKNRPEATQLPTVRKCPECLSDIPIQARRCAQCGQPVATITPTQSAKTGF